MRRFHGVALAAAGIVLGCLLTVHPITGADRPDPASEAAVNSQEEMVNQLKEINAQLKDIGALLRSGDVKVTIVMNPDAKPE